MTNTESMSQQNRDQQAPQRYHWKNWSLSREFIYQSQLSRNAGRFEVATEYLWSAFALDCTDPLIYRGLAHLAYDSMRIELVPMFRKSLLLAAAPEGLVAYFDGVALFRKGRLAEADACFRISIDHEPSNLYAYNNLGISYILQSQPHRASHVLKWALERFKKAHDKKGVALCKGNLGLSLIKRNRLTQAQACLSATAKLSAGEYLIPERLNALCNLAELWIACNKLERAKLVSRDALTLARFSHSVQQEIRSLITLGAVDRILGDHDAAHSKLQEALLLIARTHDAYWRKATLEQMYVLQLATGETDRAKALYSEASEIRTSHNSSPVVNSVTGVNDVLDRGGRTGVVSTETVTSGQGGDRRKRHRGRRVADRVVSSTESRILATEQCIDDLVSWEGSYA